MAELSQLLEANKAYAATYAHGDAEARPRRRLAVVTCMDTRIDVLAALGLRIGDAHILRNVGGRVTDDVLRSLALSTHVLGVNTLVVMQHTKCGLAGVTDDELRSLTGAELRFLPINDHTVTLREDVDLVAATSFLTPLDAVAGFVYDVENGGVEEVVRWERPANSG
ncbi:MAG TPA: carbonic anhydrase [Acidimicrobiales bacterium]|nr:carbonic anhydrase [Acidimicrobiales bacterium]